MFVRLKESAPLDSALEAQQPVRFVFVLVGPSKSDMDYRETGRAMAALMADKVSSTYETSKPRVKRKNRSPTNDLCPSQVFNKAVLQAKSPRELMDAVADFMDCSIVIPPTEIQNEAMLAPIISFQKKLLQDRIQASKPMLPLDSKPRRGGRQNAVQELYILCTIHIVFAGVACSLLDTREI